MWYHVRQALYNESFKSKIKSIHYNACITIIRRIQGISRERIYQELRLKFLSDMADIDSENLAFFIRFYKVFLRNISLSTRRLVVLLITKLNL